MTIEFEHCNECGWTGDVLELKGKTEQIRQAMVSMLICPSCDGETTSVTQEQLDNNAVDELAKKMKEKLSKKRGQNFGGWEDCSQEHLSTLLKDHVVKGDPVDVANFCAFLSARGLSI